MEQENITKYTNAEDSVEKSENMIVLGSQVVIGGNDDQRAKMFEAMSKYYAEVQNPENTTVNTFFKAKYAPLNEVLNTIRPIMAKYGLSCTQNPGVDKGECSVATLLMHSAGGYIYYPGIKGSPTKGDVQGIGATITYLRRFAINAVAGVSGEVDDDGNTSARKTTNGTVRKGTKQPNKSVNGLDEEIEKIRTEIERLKADGVSTDDIKTAIDKSGSPKNYNKINDIAVAEALLKQLQALGTLTEAKSLQENSDEKRDNIVAE